MTIEPRRLLHLLAVARAGTFGKAAQQLRVSQPALSKSIAALEHSVGVRVMERSRKGATLTDFGRMLCDRAQAIESLLDAADDEVKLTKLGQRGTLRVGASPVGCVGVVPEAVAMLTTAVPNAEVTITEMQDDALLEGLMKGAIDVAISPSGSRKDPNDIECQPLFFDKLVVACARTNPLAKRRLSSLKQISGARFVMPAPGTSIYSQIEGLFSTAGVRWPELVITSNSLLLIKSMVRADHAITIISDQMIRPEVSAGWFTAIPLREKVAVREISIRRWKLAPPNALLDRFIFCLAAVVH